MVNAGGFGGCLPQRGLFCPCPFNGANSGVCGSAAGALLGSRSTARGLGSPWAPPDTPLPPQERWGARVLGRAFCPAARLGVGDTGDQPVWLLEGHTRRGRAEHPSGRSGGRGAGSVHRGQHRSAEPGPVSRAKSGALQRLGTVLSRSEARIPSGGAKGQTFEPSPSGPGPCSSPAGSEAASCACARLRPRAVTLERAEPLPSGCLSVRDPRLALLCCQTPLMASAGYRTDSCQRPWPGPPAPAAAPAHPQLQRSPAAARWLSRSALPSEPSLFGKEPLPTASSS